MAAFVTTVFLLTLMIKVEPLRCSPLQLVPLEDEIHDSVHNTHFNLSPQTTTTSRSPVAAQMEEYLSDIDFNLLHVTNESTSKTDDDDKDEDVAAHHLPANATDTRNASAVINEADEEGFLTLRTNTTSLDGELDHDNSSLVSDGVHLGANATSSLDSKVIPENGTNDTMTISGLNDDGGQTAVSLNESSSTKSDQHETLQPSINDLEDDDDRPSVLDFHPVVNKSAAAATIRFRSGVPEEWHPYTKLLSTFLDSYDKDAQANNVHCDFERHLSDDQACRFDLVYLGPSCTKENNFGYGIGKPCVLLSPAKMADWVPTTFDNESTSIPDEVHRLMRIFNSNFMFVTCEGESESDRANIGPIAYLPPYSGFPSYFFPYKGDKVPSYVAPLMAVEFLNPTNGTLINVLCRAYARNLPDLPRQARLRFSLQVN